MSTALIIIDVQNDYFPNGSFELVQAEQALAATQKLLAHFRAKNLPVYFVQHIATPTATFFRPNSEGVQIHSAIVPLPHEHIVRKHAPNSFYNTDLQTELQKISAQELIICGMMTHMCVDTTVRAAKDLGYTITLISDACATKDLEWSGSIIAASTVQSVYLASLNGAFANILSSTDYLAQLANT